MFYKYEGEIIRTNNLFKLYDYNKLLYIPPLGFYKTNPKHF